MNTIAKYKSLKFGTEFNHPIDNLPIGVEIITIINQKYSHDIVLVHLDLVVCWLLNVR